MGYVYTICYSKKYDMASEWKNLYKNRYVFNNGEYMDKYMSIIEDEYYDEEDVVKACMFLEIKYPEYRFEYYKKEDGFVGFEYE